MDNVPAVIDPSDTPSRELAPRAAEPDMGALLSALATGGVTADNVDALERIAAVWERQEERRTRREFDDALAALQAECRMVNPNREVPGKTKGEVRSVFADYAHIWRQAGPLVAKHGFSVSWDTEMVKDPLRLVMTCLLSKGGHSRPTKFAARVSAPPGCSDAQADGSTNSYAKRYALCNALNIVVGYDDDARAEGDTISPDEAADLEDKARARWPGDDKAIERFLKFCGAERWEDICRARYNTALSELNRQPTPPAQPTRRCPADPSDHTAWTEAMAEEMSCRWQCDMSAAGKVVTELAKAAVDRGGPLTPERRGMAWANLLNGGFDAHKPAQPAAAPTTDLWPGAGEKPNAGHPDAPRSKR